MRVIFIFSLIALAGCQDFAPVPMPDSSDPNLAYVKSHNCPYMRHIPGHTSVIDGKEVGSRGFSAYSCAGVFNDVFVDDARR